MSSNSTVGSRVIEALSRTPAPALAPMVERHLKAIERIGRH
jgi:hypothetical protein